MITLLRHDLTVSTLRLFTDNFEECLVITLLNKTTQIIKVVIDMSLDANLKFSR